MNTDTALTQNMTTRQRTELTENRKQQDEKDVQGLLSTIQHMNPFGQTLEKESLHSNITSGLVASEAVSADLLNAKAR